MGCGTPKQYLIPDVFISIPLSDFIIDNNIIFKNNIESSSYTLISEFAKMGLGIGISTKEYIEEDLNNKLLYEIKLQEKLPDRYIGIATLKN